MKVEIWSDVVCPFCYMGKRKFERALERFEHRDEVEVTWRSFQLDPALEAGSASIHEYLAERKGMPVEAVRRMHARLVAAAAAVGLRYDFDKAVVANTFDAHRLTHLARAHGLQAGLEERLFAAYFTEGRDLGDREALAALAAEVGLDQDEARETLAGGRFADAVRSEAAEAQSLGADGVPFFVFDRAYAVAGAQDSDLFLEVLQKVHAEQEAAPASR